MFPCPIYTIIYNSLVGTSREKRTKTIKKRKKDKKRQQLLHTRLVDTWLKKNRREAPPLGLSGKGGKSPSLATHLPTREGSASPSPHWQRGESSPLHTPPARRPRTGRRLEPKGGDRERGECAKASQLAKLASLAGSEVGTACQAYAACHAFARLGHSVPCVRKLRRCHADAK